MVSSKSIIEFSIKQHRSHIFLETNFNVISVFITIVIMNNRFFIGLVILLSLFIERRISLLHTSSVNVQPTVIPTKARESAIPAVKTRATVINVVNPRVDSDANIIGENVQNNVQINSSTEIGLDINFSRSNKLRIGNRNSQSYRNRTVKITEEKFRNYLLETLLQEPTNNDHMQFSQRNQSSQQLGSTMVSNLAIGTIDRVSEPTEKVYSSNPTYSKGNTVTDEDLEKLSEALYIKETNNPYRYITFNLQKQTTSSSTIDQASQVLLTVSPEAFQIPTIQRVFSIFDNYQLDTHINEYISPIQRQEESLLIDTFLNTNVMSATMRFLADKGFVKQDYNEYKSTLRRIWFNLFSRGQGKISSTGFEHVFMAEIKQRDSGPEVLGLHNWIYFNVEEMKRHIDYLGYIKKVDLGNKGFIIKMHVRFNDHDKPVTTMFIGTSPELEMALYTICFYARADRKCPVSLGGTKFNIITHKFRYRGKYLIGTAYPEI